MSIFVLVIVIFLSALIIKVGAISLRMTGLDKETAAFQALSAFTGTGFTTSEAENIVNHSQRRKVVKALMLLGNIGIVSSLAVLFLSIRSEPFVNSIAKLGIVGFFLILLVSLPVIKGLDNVIDSFISKRLRKMKGFSMGSYSEIVRLASGYGIGELHINKANPLAGKKLDETGLTSRNIIVLAIKRGFHLIAAPKAGEVISAGDRLVCFGNLKSLSTAGSDTGESE
ncbi:MAG: TrkA C-terminal domain-containing protein [Bacteroidales bacterium]|nr:TrkA C-terminal domain-containing protein [Candidatus Latescibacterota bacterium]